MIWRQLDQNDIETVETTDFEYTPHIRNLRLDGNRLHFIPTNALQTLVSLEVLWVSLCRNFFLI